MDVSITVTGSVGMIRALLDHFASLSATAAEAVTIAAGPPPALMFPNFPDVPGMGVTAIAPVIPPTPAAVSTAVTAQLDANGLPWDARINTSNKAQTKKLVWKRVPGISDEVYGKVINELRAAKGLAPVAVEPEVPTVPVLPAAPAAVPPVAMPPAPQPELPATPPTPPVTAESVPTTFPELLQAIGKRTVCTPTKISTGEINDICLKYGLSTLAAANTQQHLVPFLYNDMAALWNTRG